MAEPEDSGTAKQHSTDILKEIILVDEEGDDTEEYIPIESIYADFIALPISHYDLRNKIRDQGFPSDAARQFWWPIIAKFANKEPIEELPDVIALARKRLAHFKEACPENDRSTVSLYVPIDFSWDEDKSGNIAHNVVRLLVSDPEVDMEDPGLVQPFAKHISQIVANTAICYTMCCDLLLQPQWYLNASIVNHRCKLLVFKQLVKRCMARTYDILISLGAMEDAHLNLIFVDMFTTILPTSTVHRVVDMYLLDGVKVLYRYGLALFKVHKRAIKEGVFKKGDDFWACMKKYRTGEVALDFTELHNFAFDLNQPFYKMSIVPSRHILSSMEAHIRSHVSDAVLRLSLQLPYASSLPSTIGTEHLLHHKSHILDLFLARRLYAFLPEAMRIQGFDRVFATYKNGWNLFTLYDRVKGRRPCILLIKTVDAQAVIGMYLSCTLAPSVSIRGDGDCFCFRLDGPNGACYRWALAPKAPPLLESGVYQNSLTFHQFALCTSEYMSFGGSSVHATNALHVTGDLMTCSSGHSDTYNNPPLCPDEPNDPFQIEEMEIFVGSES